jgi:DNA polymerase/3'-5' exonuclease PolX
MNLNNTNKYPLEFARNRAEEILHAIQPACHQAEIAGSIRRQRPQVHDIDIVAWPITQPINKVDLFGNIIEQGLTMEDLLEALYGAGVDDLQVGSKTVKGVYRGIRVELYLTEPDGSNWGALLQMRTGSEEFNISLCERAIKLGLKYKAGYGVYRGEERIDVGTEAGIFEALMIDNIDPEYRNTHWHTATRMASI